MANIEKAKELCRKYVERTEYYDELIEDDFVKMPPIAHKVVNQLAKLILGTLEENGTEECPRCKGDGHWHSTVGFRKENPIVKCPACGGVATKNPAQSEQNGTEEETENGPEAHDGL